MVFPSRKQLHGFQTISRFRAISIPNCFWVHQNEPQLPLKLCSRKWMGAMAGFSISAMACRPLRTSNALARLLRLYATDMSQLHVDLDLVRKYNVAGPRYTSYPPATKFTDQITWPQLAEELIANNREVRDLSLYFH